DAHAMSLDVQIRIKVSSLRVANIRNVKRQVIDVLVSYGPLVDREVHDAVQVAVAEAHAAEDIADGEVRAGAGRKDVALQLRKEISNCLRAVNDDRNGVRANAGNRLYAPQGNAPAKHNAAQKTIARLLLVQSQDPPHGEQDHVRRDLAPPPHLLNLV